MKTLKVRSDLAELDRIRDFLKETLRGHHVSEEEAFKIELSLIEICTNIVLYAYPEGDGDILIKMWSDNGIFYLEIRDHGIPFDPRQMELPKIEELISRQKKGGLGILLARKLMDSFSYQRENDQNVLLMGKKTKKQAEG